MKSVYKEYNLACDMCGADLRDFDGVLVLRNPEVRNTEARKIGFKVIQGKDVCPYCVPKMK